MENNNTPPDSVITPQDSMDPMTALRNTGNLVPPDEAAINIKKANALGMEPDNFVEMKDPLYKYLQDPLPKRVADEATSRQHASIIEADKSIFKIFTDYTDYISDSFKVKNTQRELNQLYRDKMFPSEGFDPDTNAFNIALTEKKLKDMNVDEKYGLSFTESIPGMVASEVYNMGWGLANQPALILSGLGAGAAAGAKAGAAGGPGAMAALAATGGIAGLALSSKIAFAVDSISEITAMTYADMERDATLFGEVPEENRKAIAMGTGIIAGSIDALPFSAAIKRLPVMRKLSRGKLSGLMADPRLLGIVTRIGRSFAEEGGTEVVQDFIQSFGTNLGASFDGDENKFIESLEKSVDQFSAKEAGQTFLVGGLTGSVVTGGLETAGRVVDATISTPKVEAQPAPAPKVPEAPVIQDIETDIITPDVNDSVVLKAGAAVNLKNHIDRTAELLAPTKTNELLPQEMNRIIYNTFTDKGIEKVYVDKDALNEWADTPEKADMVQPIIDDKVLTEANINAPIEIPIDAAIRLAMKDKDISSLYKPRAEAPSTLDWIKDQDRLRAEENPQLNERQDVFGEQLYTEQTTFDTPENNTELMESKKKVVQSLKEDADKGISEPINYYLEHQKAMDTQAGIESATTNETVDKVDNYLKNKMVVGPLDSNQKKRVDKGGLAYAINPESLDPDLRLKFGKDPTLKKRKVFSRDGLRAEEVATIMGVSNVNDLLTILRDIPTKQEAFQIYEAYTNGVSQVESRSNRDVRDASFNAAYDGVTQAHLNEVKIINKKAATNVQVPNVESLKSEAQYNINNTQVKNLNPTKYKVAERVSQRKASQSINEGKYQEAAKQKINAAKASQLAKESHVAISKTNRIFTYIANVKTGKNKFTFDNTRKEIQDGINHLLDVFGFDLDNRGTTSPDALPKLQKFLNASGENINVEIPPEVYAWTANQPRPQDLSVDQLEYIYNQIQSLMHVAETRNEFYGDKLDMLDAETVDILAESLLNDVMEQANYDAKRLAEKPQPITVMDKAVRSIKGMARWGDNMLHTLNKIGDGKENAKLTAMLYTRLSKGFAEKSSQLGQMTEYAARARKKYGKDFDLRMNERIFVPEFKDIAALNYGNLTRMELVVMFANLGNEVNASRVSNFGITKDMAIYAIQKHTDKRDTDFVKEAWWDYHDDNLQRYYNHIKRTTGKEIDVTVKSPVTIHGVTYSGGHMALRYRRSEVMSKQLDLQINAVINATDLSESMYMDYSDAFEGIVRSQHDKTRGQNDMLLDLTFDGVASGLESLAHDYNLRVPIRDAMTIIKHPKVKQAIVGTVGIERYQERVDDLAYMSKSMGDVQAFKDVNENLKTIASRMRSAEAIFYVAYNLKSAMLSPANLGGAFAVMSTRGKNSGYYLIKSAMGMANLATMRRYLDMAKEVDTTLADYNEAKNAISSSSSQVGLSKIRSKIMSGKVGIKIGQGFDAFTEFGISTIHQTLDRVVKGVVANAAYAQYVNGDLKNTDRNVIESMTKEELHNKAVQYVSEISSMTTYSDSTLDRSNVQKQGDSLARILMGFFNDARNEFNISTQLKRNYTNRGKKAAKLAKEGDYIGAHHAMMDANNNMLHLMVYVVAVLAFKDYVRGLNPFQDEDDQVDGRPQKMEGLQLADVLGQAPSWLLGHFQPMTEGGQLNTNFLPIKTFKHFAGSHPLARLVMNSFEYSKAPTPASIDVITSATKGVMTIPKYYSLAEQDLTMMTLLNETTEQEFRNLTAMFALTPFALPGNAITNFRKWMLTENISLPDLSITKNIAESAMMAFESDYLPESNSEDDFQKALQELRSGKIDTTTMEEYAKQVREMREGANPINYASITDSIPDEFFEVIKFAESDGKWNSRNSRSTAFGFYQFTQGTWNDVINSPEGRAEGLKSGHLYTVKGQELGMRIFTAQNIRELQNQQVPISLQSIYFAHHFGTNNAAKVLNSPDNYKLPASFLTSSVKKANPALVTRNVKTTGDLKDYLNWVLNQGEKKLEKANQ